MQTRSFLHLKKRTRRSSPILVLPWPARMWKPEMGAVERSLQRTLPLRIALTVLVVAAVWFQSARHPLGAVVFSALAPFLILVAYPRQRRREVRLPFKVEIGSKGIDFRLDERLWVNWSDIASCALRETENPHIKRLEVLVKGKRQNLLMVFPYDPDEIDEDVLCDLFESHLPSANLRSLRPVVFPELPPFSRN